MRHHLICALAALAPLSALAQSDAQSASARASADQVRLGDAVEPEHAAGDWGGARSRWKAAGVDLQLGYLSETVDIANGGLRRGADYAHQIKLQADLDGKPLLGVDGLGFHTAIINRTGRNASADHLGDDLFQVQEIYGATGNAALHLSYLYAEYGAAHGAVDVKAGRMSVGQDFAASPLYCQYLTLGLCPQPRALPLEPAFSAVPSATWSARLRVSAKAAYVAVGLYQARPRYGGPSGFDWGFSGTTGVIVPAEIGWEPRFGRADLQGHYKAGISLDTSDYPRVDPLAPSLRERVSWWVLADQMLVRTDRNGTDGLMMLAGWAHSDPRAAVVSDLGFAGIAARGILKRRRNDALDLLIGHASISGDLTRAQEASVASGRPLPTGFPMLPGSFAETATAPGIQTSHDFVEVNYGVKLRTGITVTPDLQYLWRPGASRSVPDALVLGGRFELNF